MTEPTDAEIRGLAHEGNGVYQDDETAVWEITDPSLIKFARAVLAKWGTTPAVAGEDRLRAAAIELRDAPDLRAMQRATAKLYAAIDTTQQPTQAQAVAVPLTDVARWISTAQAELDGVETDDANNCLKAAHGALEKALSAINGIKGGQHGESV